MNKISLLTVTFNSIETISDTVNSIACQSLKPFEYVVIDGGSTDGTVDFIRNNVDFVSLLISEKDDGLYHAMNNGLVMLTGDVVGIINSDDVYASNDVLKVVSDVFTDPTIDACYGNLNYVPRKNLLHTVRAWISKDYSTGAFKSGWMPPHPTFFVRRKCYDQYGLFNTKYHYVADFELMFRFIEQAKIKAVYIPKLFIKMRLGGKTSKNIFNVYYQNKELIKILTDYYSDFSILNFISNKIFDRSLQLIRPIIRKFM